MVVGQARATCPRHCTRAVGSKLKIVTANSGLRAFRTSLASPFAATTGPLRRASIARLQVYRHTRRVSRRSQIWSSNSLMMGNDCPAGGSGQLSGALPGVRNAAIVWSTRCWPACQSTWPKAARECWSRIGGALSAITFNHTEAALNFLRHCGAIMKPANDGWQAPVSHLTAMFDSHARFPVGAECRERTSRRQSSARRSPREVSNC